MKKLAAHKDRLMFGLVLLCAILIVSNSCTKDNSNTDGTNNGSGGPGANEVWIKDTAYNPSTITVNAGTTVKWTNKDAVTHTVTSTTGLFDSGNIGNGDIYTHQFGTSGSYPYTCTLHPAMSGTVVVN
jgi:plastocyanin